MLSEVYSAWSLAVGRSYHVASRVFLGSRTATGCNGSKEDTARDNHSVSDALLSTGIPTPMCDAGPASQMRVFPKGRTGWYWQPIEVTIVQLHYLWRRQ